MERLGPATFRAFAAGTPEVFARTTAEEVGFSNHNSARAATWWKREQKSAAGSASACRRENVLGPSETGQRASKMP